MFGCRLSNFFHQRRHLGKVNGKLIQFLLGFFHPLNAGDRLLGLVFASQRPFATERKRPPRLENICGASSRHHCSQCCLMSQSAEC